MLNIIQKQEEQQFQWDVITGGLFSWTFDLYVEFEDCTHLTYILILKIVPFHEYNLVTTKNNAIYF